MATKHSRPVVSEAASENASGDGISSAILTQPTDQQPVDRAVENIQLRRRRAASWRLPPLADGRRDPIDPIPSDREVLRHVWWTLARHGLLTAAMRSELCRLASHREVAG
jgi:hypothetical protein